MSKAITAAQANKYQIVDGTCTKKSYIIVAENSDFQVGVRVLPQIHSGGTQLNGVHYRVRLMPKKVAKFAEGAAHPSEALRDTWTSSITGLKLNKCNSTRASAIREFKSGTIRLSHDGSTRGAELKAALMELIPVHINLITSQFKNMSKIRSGKDMANTYINIMLGLGDLAEQPD